MSPHSHLSLTSHPTISPHLTSLLPHLLYLLPSHTTPSTQPNTSLLQHTHTQKPLQWISSLSRKELQVLYKNNKIPANMTNVAMPDTLAALPNVNILEENDPSPMISVETASTRGLLLTSTDNFCQRSHSSKKEAFLTRKSFRGL